MADVVMLDGNKNSDCSTEGGEDKIENVSGSVSDGDNNPNGSLDSNNQVPKRKKKTRRGKNKKRKYKPYNKLSWQERRELEDRETQRANRTRAEMFAHGQPVAPYNTTQFLMDDHNDVQDLDLQLKSVLVGDINTHVPIVTHRNSRMRDSSFSLDSEEDFFYSSPEDEEEFLTKEFSNTYEVVHTERLNTMSKTELIQELIGLEEKVEQMDKKLKEYRAKERGEEIKIDLGMEAADLTNNKRKTVVSLPEEMKKLVEENAELRHELEKLKWNLGKCRCRHGRQAKVSSSSSASVDSDSDSTSSVSSSSNSSCSSGSGCRVNRKPLDKKRHGAVKKTGRAGDSEVKENKSDLSVPVVNGCVNGEHDVSRDSVSVYENHVNGTSTENRTEEDSRQSPARGAATSESGSVRSRNTGNVGDVDMDVEMSHTLK